MIENYKKSEVVIQMELEYPEMTSEYKKIMLEGYEIFCKKQSNYGPHNISVGTTLANRDDVRLSLTGIWFRVNDKINRLKQLVVLGKTDHVGESVEDTLQDLGVYAIIAQIVNRQKWAK
jgi:hypothetical protein